MYQYRRIDGNDLDFFKQLALRHELYLGSPSRFNDPFDSKVDIDFSEATEEDWRRFFRTALKREEDAERVMALKRYEDPEHLRGIEVGLQTDIDKAGVACLSEIPDSILMWSHYAASHTGVCIEFDHTQTDSIIARAMPVSYSSDYRPIKAFRDDSRKQINLVLLTKSRNWCYEREWRIVDLEGGVGVKSIPPSSIKAIILGCRIESTKREEILSWLSECAPKPRLLQARKRAKHYGLEFEVIKSDV